MKKLGDDADDIRYHFHFVCTALTDHQRGALSKFLISVNALESSELIASLPAQEKLEFRNVFIERVMQEVSG